MSWNKLSYKHISDAATEAVNYIEGRRQGTIKSLRTSKEKLNKALLDGIEWWRIFTIAGLSGSGKSTICEELKRDLVALNPDQNFKILSFEFEMLALDQISRSISGRIGKTTKELYSHGKPLTDQDMQRVVEQAEEMKRYPIYYIDTVGTVNDIKETVKSFVEEHQMIERNEGLVVTIDHVLLTKGRQGQSEKSSIDELAHACVELKKEASRVGLKILFILLAQLNRNIESPDRIANSAFHYPNKNDIFGASSLYYCSDYVMISHKPCIINGIQKWYGPPLPEKGYPNGLPVWNPQDNNQAMVYWHLIKERFGTTKTLMMLDEFKHSRVGEYKP